MFDLKRPCKTCPFRKGNGEHLRINGRTLREIVYSPSYQCGRPDAGDAEFLVGVDRPQQCAGLMAVLHREGLPNQIMQVAERLGQLDAQALDPANEAYSSVKELLSAHCHRLDVA